jgi:predicted NUDIX family NTP pyrophosphohydrolase
MAEIISCGLLMYCRQNNYLKVFLVHPGGPFFTKKDDGYWGIPKGLLEKGENPLDAARREFFEETGIAPGTGLIPLGEVVQKGGKKVLAWAFECSSDDPVEITCNTFSLEWPPKSGKIQNFPEVDKGCFFEADEAKRKINSSQALFITRLVEYLNGNHNKQE